MTSIRKAFADNMRFYRAELGFSQAKLAEKANTATHYISMIELEKKFPSADMIERIAEALEIDSLDLFSRAPVQQRWEEAVLGEIEKLITDKLDLASRNKIKLKECMIHTRPI
jgi:transcriptional regulator with XRE-family HTH domain